jgi:dTDP-4-dehydrorhamnose reductase
VRILVTGAGGQLGRAVTEAFCRETVVGVPRAELDICHAATVERLITEFRPDLVVNAAGYTRVDQAETERDAAWRVNALGPAVLAEAAKLVDGCRLVHISTDYVFRGDARRPYRPESKTDPICVYGKTKREGELAVLNTLGDRAVVLRTAWVYSARGRNFLTTMLRIMRSQDLVKVVGDQRGSPTVASSVARAVVAIANRPAAKGVLHWTDEGVVSWYEFASAIAREAAAAGLISRPVHVTKIGSDEFPAAALRPKYSALDTSESQIQLDLRPVRWMRSLRAEIRVLTDA